MKILCVFGQHNYGDPEKGAGTEYSAFIPALKNLGHTVEHFESWNRQCFRDFRELNQALLARVEDTKPNLMLTVQTHFELWLETLNLIKNRGDVATISWATDDSWKYEECSRFIGQGYHAMTTTYPEFIPRYHADGIPFALRTQWGVTQNNLREPRVGGPWKYPVSFIGSANAYRKKRVAELHTHGIHVDCFGFGWPSGPLEAERIPEILNDSCISLNFAASRGTNQLKARTFEVPGAGSLLFTEPAPLLTDYFQGEKEIVIFHGVEELAEKIRLYLTHPDKRDQIACAGFQRARQEHTYEKRLQEVVAFAMQAHQSYRQKKKESRPVVSFARACKDHRTGIFLQFLKSLLLVPANALFGEKRGPRAARRLVYEVSHRLLKEKTYSAAGLPGRLFYHAS